MKDSKLAEIAKTFEQEEYDIPQALEYYSGIEGATMENVSHPDHLWTILDRMHTMAMEAEEREYITVEQRDFLQSFLNKWMDEIEPYLVEQTIG